MSEATNATPITAEALREAYAKIERTGYDGRYPDEEAYRTFVDACRTGNHDLADAFVKAGFVAAGAAPSASIPPAIVEAAKANRTAIVAMLLAGGADPNREDENGTTALIYAAAHGNVEMVYMLVHAGAKLNHLSKVGWTPLAFAAKQGAIHTVRVLLDAGADPNAPESGLKPITFAATTQLVELLLHQGANPDVDADLTSRTSLLLTQTAAGREDIVRLLLSRGAVDRPNGAGVTANMVARDEASPKPSLAAALGGDPVAYDTRLVVFARAGNRVAIESALRRKTDAEVAEALRAHDMYGTTPLIAAVLGHHWDLAEELLARGASPHAVNLLGTSPLSVAAVAKNTNIAKKLLDRGASPNTPDGSSRALTESATLGCAPMLELLLDAGADINAVDAQSRTALFLACNGSFEDVASFLLDRGANPNLADANLETPLMRACRMKLSRTVERLLELGASYESVSAQGLTAFTEADAVMSYEPAVQQALLARVRRDGVRADTVSAEQLRIMTVVGTLPDDIGPLLDAGLSIERWNENPQVFVRACASNAAVAKELLARGATFTGNDGRGLYAKTALMGAAENDLELVQQLLTRGAEANELLSFALHKTALAVALANGRQDNVEALFKAGADPDLYVGMHGARTIAATWEITDFNNAAREMENKRAKWAAAREAATQQTAQSKTPKSKTPKSKAVKAAKAQVANDEKDASYSVEGLPQAEWAAKSAFLFAEFQKQRRPQKDKALRALISLLEQDGELARTHLTPFLETCEHGPWLLTVARSALRGAPDPASVIAAALQVTQEGKAKAKSYNLWPLRMLALDWHLKTDVPVRDPELFSPFNKATTSKLEKLAGRLPLIPPTDAREEAFYAMDNSSPQRRVLTYAERYLIAALRGTTPRYEGDLSAQDFEVGHQHVVFANRTYVEFGWLPVSQFHVLLSHTGEGMGVDPEVYCLDEGDAPVSHGSLSNFLKQLKPASAKATQSLNSETGSSRHTSAT
jgi:ankyrin repeat protein